MRTGPINCIQRESLLSILDRIYDAHNRFPGLIAFLII